MALFTQPAHNALRDLEAAQRVTLSVQQIENAMRGLEAANRLALFTQPAFAQQVENSLRGVIVKCCGSPRMIRRLPVARLQLIE